METQKHTATGYTEMEDYRCLENLQRSLMDLCLVYCGREKTRKGVEFKTLPRRHYSIHFVESGKGVFRLGEKTYRLQKGDLFFIQPGVACSYRADAADPWTYSWIGFTGIAADRYVTRCGLGLNSPVSHTDSLDRISALIKKILDSRSLSLSGELFRDACLMMILSLLVEGQEKKAGSGDLDPERSGPDYIQKAVVYIDDHFEKNIRIGELASFLGVSRSHFSSAFRKAVGCSVQEYIMSLRMNKAVSLLRETSMPVGAVAAAVGYGDQLAFSRVFRKRYGVSPLHFRNQERELLVFSQKGDFKDSDL